MIMRNPSITAFKKELAPEQREELLRALKARFEKNVNRRGRSKRGKRHPNFSWRGGTLADYLTEEKSSSFELQATSRTPATNQILRCGSPLRESELETTLHKTARDDAAALEYQFGFGA